MIRVGIVGCGFVGALHSRGLKALRDADVVDAGVVATCDADPARAEAFARAHGASCAVTDPAALLAEVDAVLVCTPTATHRALVEAAAAQGVAVLCEKPLAPSLADAEAIAGSVAAAGVTGQVGLVLRHSPVLSALAELVRSGSLGRPMTAVLRDDQYFPVQGQYASTWRGDRALAGGGTLLEHSIHDLDVLRWVLGEIDEAGAVTANFAAYDGIEDLAVVTLRFRSGAVATLASVWHQLLVRPSTRRLEVVCERGIAWLEDEYTGPLHVQTDEGTTARTWEFPTWTAGLALPEPWRRAVTPYAVALRGFLDAVAEGTDGCPDLACGVAAHRVADAAYRSAIAGGAPLPVALL